MQIQNQLSSCFLPQKQQTTSYDTSKLGFESDSIVKGKFVCFKFTYYKSAEDFLGIEFIPNLTGS